ncbi:MAG: phosphoribosylaminoimidazolesuccinocarboxamide synthase [candidate division WOR-3 bacterium]|nr:MAG: phosphoribosylaminoimidazolesuccinocarboxamide synthase [candidate division WOR-3 bacterium]
MNNAVGDITLPGVKKVKSGKVREVFDLDDTYLIVASDRISAFDYILPTLIPHKGEILTKLSVFWFEKTKHIIQNHLITANVEEYPEILKSHKDVLRDRSMLVKKTQPVEVECVVRGYIAGSGWKDYQKTGMVAGRKIENLMQGDKLPESLFTPATKAQTGHDINISFQEMKNIVPEKDAEYIRKKSIELYTFAHTYARERDVIIADTKFEFGRLDDKIILIDEIFTPDSSRFWDPDLYKPGSSQASFDKQFVRDYLSSTDWDKNSPPPQLPDEIVEKTVARYREALERIIEVKR